MSSVDIEIAMKPETLMAFSRNEVQMDITLKNQSPMIYWSECDVAVVSPLSLAHDGDMASGRTRIGILKPMSKINKSVRLYTRPNNYPDDYKVSIVAYVYDGDGAIAERIEKKIEIPCREKERPMQGK